MLYPLLYTYRRCPYAMRARSVLISCGIEYETREIKLNQKPPQMLEASPKGTVPVLILPSGEVLEESLDIIKWALKQTPGNDLTPSNPNQQPEIDALIAQNDTHFKKNLDAYKYKVPEKPKPQPSYRDECEKFLLILEQKLQHSPFLFDSKITYADLAILPFVRQFAAVDPQWFEQTHPRLQQWLSLWIKSDLFEAVMKK